MNLSQNKEDFFRAFFARQRDISKQALIATATMAQANMEMILSNGLINVKPKILTEVQEDVNIQGQLEEIKKDIESAQKTIVNNTEDIITAKDKAVVQEAKVRAVEKDVKEVQVDIEIVKEEASLAQNNMRNVGNIV